MPQLLIIFGTAGIIASLVVAYKKGIIKKQLIFVSVLAVVWWIMFVVKASTATGGITQDQVGLPKTIFIELFVGYIYPYTIAPLIAVAFAVFKGRE